MSTSFDAFLDRVTPRVDAALDRLLPKVSVRPRVIHDAMRYTALSEGKRLRPALVILAYEASGGRGRRIDAVAAALEMVHAFSLIHDDLPCMDDDDFRRGKPASHKVYGEGVAVLAGDALLAAAFGTLASLRGPRGLGPAITAALVAELAESSGSLGVIGGQVLDLLSEGESVPRATVEYIHRHKTARLFTAALRLGGLAAGAKPGVLRRLSAYGESVGIAFQIVDDILSAAGTVRELGRDPGRDEARGKVTYPAVVGLRGSHRAVDRHLAEAARVTRGLPRPKLFDGLRDLIDRRRRDPADGLLGLGQAP